MTDENYRFVWRLFLQDSAIESDVFDELQDLFFQIILPRLDLTENRISCNN